MSTPTIEAPSIVVLFFRLRVSLGSHLRATSETKMKGKGKIKEETEANGVHVGGGESMNS